uniref:Coiled-coil domain-containing protein 50 n=1 Tax=Phallusia mammillata TaxID=59560 RepID=A0A6F9D960_9ASCI|nr:coiled-coil domain-containing protein 50 [Phallusia mammillata]
MASRMDQAIETKNLRPVNEAVVEYRVIEDGALAHYLQEREIEHHFENNVSERRRVMGDIKTAKELQDEEDRKARILTLDEQEQLKEMDEQLAEDVQKKLILEERERKEREAKDNEIAMMIRERDRRRELRQKRSDHELAQKLSELDMSPSDHSRMREMSDEELAKRLQEEEKLRLRRTEARHKNIKTVVEMQDEELARYIHERDMYEAEMMHRQQRSKSKRTKMPRGEPPPGYHRPDERYEPRPSSSRHRDEHHSRQPDSHHSHGRPEEHSSSRHPGEQGKRPGPRRPPQPSGRDRDETVPKSIEADLPDSPASHRRHTVRQQTTPSFEEERPKRRTNSERPRRPPPPSSSSRNGEDMNQRDLQRRRYEENSRTRSEEHPRLAGDVDPDDITYGPGFARLAEEEVRMRQEEEAYLRERKKNKGDCKQQ